jgi:aminoglycoside phosphotransferase (APT) family kinase protein
MVDGDLVRLIDFDRVARGAPLIDLGDFLARMEKAVVEGGGPERLVDEGERALCAAYEQAAGRRLDERALAWHRAVGRARVALNAVTHLKPGWRRRATEFLRRAHDALAPASPD